MAESNQLTWEVDNTFIPKYTPNNLKWYKKDGLGTCYRQNKCNEFLNNTDECFKKMKITNFDIIKYEATEDEMKQYQKYNMKKLNNINLQEQICSSIFRYSHCQEMHIKKKKTMKQHFVNKKVYVGRVKFLKKVKCDMYAQYW